MGREGQGACFIIGMDIGRILPRPGVERVHWSQVRFNGGDVEVVEPVELMERSEEVRELEKFMLELEWCILAVGSRGVIELKAHRKFRELKEKSVEFFKNELGVKAYEKLRGHRPRELRLVRDMDLGVTYLKWAMGPGGPLIGRMFEFWHKCDFELLQLGDGPTYFDWRARLGLMRNVLRAYPARVLLGLAGEEWEKELPTWKYVEWARVGQVALWRLFEGGYEDLRRVVAVMAGMREER